MGCHISSSIIFSSLSVPLHSSIPLFCFQTSPVQQRLFSAPRSPLSLSTCPLLTSTFNELDKPSLPSPPQSPFPEDTVNHGRHHDFNEVSPVSRVSLSQSSVLSIRVKDSTTASLAVSQKTEVGRAYDLYFIFHNFMIMIKWMD